MGRTMAFDIRKITGTGTSGTGAASAQNIEESTSPSNSPIFAIKKKS